MLDKINKWIWRRRSKNILRSVTVHDLLVFHSNPIKLYKKNDNEKFYVCIIGQDKIVHVNKGIELTENNLLEILEVYNLSGCLNYFLDIRRR